jgi:hypothetical protein
VQGERKPLNSFFDAFSIPLGENYDECIMKNGYGFDGSINGCVPRHLSAKSVRCRCEVQENLKKPTPDQLPVGFEPRTSRRM